MKNNSKMNLKNVVFLLVMLKMCVVFGQNFDARKRVVIDVGHGGKDSGAIGINGIQEKVVVLNIAKAMIRLNKAVLDDRLDIYLTRYCDTFVALSDRSRLAKVLKADVFVSLHCNASKTVARGVEVFGYAVEHRNTKASNSLGVCVLNEINQKLGLKKRGMKFANFQVPRETAFLCPSILIETGFVTDSHEAYYFLKSKNIEAMALAILMGLYHYFLNTEL